MEEPGLPAPDPSKRPDGPSVSETTKAALKALGARFSSDPPAPPPPPPAADNPPPEPGAKPINLCPWCKKTVYEGQSRQMARGEVWWHLACRDTSNRPKGMKMWAPGADWRPKKRRFHGRALPKQPKRKPSEDGD